MVICFAFLIIWASFSEVCQGLDIFQSLDNDTVNRERITAPQVKVPIAIQVKASVYTANSRLYLGDIAGCKGLLDICDELQWIDLGPGPTPGGRIKVKGSSIENRLAEEFSHLKIDVKGANTVTVQGEYERISPSWLEEHVRQHVQTFASDLQVSVKKVSVYQQAKLRVWRKSLHIGFAFDQSELEFWRQSCLKRRAKLLFSISYPDHPGFGHTLEGGVTIACRVLIPVAIRDLSRGTILTERMISEKWMPYSHAFRNYISRMDQLLGNEVKTRQSAGQGFYRHKIGRSQLVKRGDVIKLIIENDGIELTTQGKATGSGYLGERIGVKRNGAATSVFGVVIGRGLVRVKM